MLQNQKPKALLMRKQPFIWSWSSPFNRKTSWYSLVKLPASWKSRSPLTNVHKYN